MKNNAIQRLVLAVAVAAFGPPAVAVTEIKLPEWPKVYPGGRTTVTKSFARDYGGWMRQVPTRCAKDDQAKWRQTIQDYRATIAGWTKDAPVDLAAIDPRRKQPSSSRTGMSDNERRNREADQKEFGEHLDKIEAWVAHQFQGIPGYGSYDEMKARLADDLKAIDALPASAPTTPAEMRVAVERFQAFDRAWQDIKTTFNEVPRDYACLQQGGDWVAAWNQVKDQRAAARDRLFALQSPLSEVVKEWARARAEVPSLSAADANQKRSGVVLRNLAYLSYAQGLKDQGYADWAEAFGDEAGSMADAFRSLRREVDEVVAGLPPQLESELRKLKPNKGHADAAKAKIARDLLKDDSRLHGDILEGDVYLNGKVDTETKDEWGRWFRLEGRYFHFNYVTDGKRAVTMEQRQRELKDRSAGPLPWMPKNYYSESEIALPRLPTIKAADLCWNYSERFIIYDKSKSGQYPTGKWFRKLGIWIDTPLLCANRGNKGEQLKKDGSEKREGLI